MTGNPLDDTYYTGEGQVFEDVFSQFFHLEEGVKIVPMPDTTWMIYSENNS
ncbi:MAG: hypothetical protein IMZ63_03020 [Actinobacteria bacterium]|nr:hypothetical protein [Actinomycetota bacterium]